MGAHSKSGERDWEVIQTSKAGVDTNLSANHVFLKEFPRDLDCMSTPTEWSRENNTSFLIPTWEPKEKVKGQESNLKAEGLPPVRDKGFVADLGHKRRRGGWQDSRIENHFLGEMQDGHKHNINGVVVVTPHKWPEINSFHWAYNYLIFQMALWMAPINALKGAPSGPSC